MIGPNLSEWSLKRPSLIVFLMIIAVAAGALAFKKLGRDEDAAFTVRTMIVAAAWPGATVEETLSQVTERLERTLQETHRFDVVRSYTTAGQTTIFVDLDETTSAADIPDVWYRVRRNIGDMRGSLPAGVVGPFFNDDFGDTFGIIYGFTADGFTFRELRDYVEGIAPSKLLQVPDVAKIELLGTQDERIHRVLNREAGWATTRLRDHRRYAPGAKRSAPGRRHPDRPRARLPSRHRCFRQREGHRERQHRRRRPHLPVRRHCNRAA